MFQKPRPSHSPCNPNLAPRQLLPARTIGSGIASPAIGTKKRISRSSTARPSHSRAPCMIDLGASEGKSAMRQGPFLGPRPFETNELDRKFFFERERETSDVLDLLLRSRLVLLYGPAGVGKTSLINAGIAPKLKERRLEPVSIDFGLVRSRLGISTGLGDTHCSLQQELIRQIGERKHAPTPLTDPPEAPD